MEITLRKRRHTDNCIMVITSGFCQDDGKMSYHLQQRLKVLGYFYQFITEKTDSTATAHSYATICNNNE